MPGDIFSHQHQISIAFLLQNLISCYKPNNTYKYLMAPSRSDNPEKEKKHLKVRAKVKRLKAEMGKIREDQRCIREEQTKLKTRFEEIERQCNELKQEVQIIAKQSAMTRLKLELMLGILKAREGGDLVQAANLTRFLREIIAKEKANAKLAQFKDEEDKPLQQMQMKNISLLNVNV